jgi:nucleoside-diphosphate-sugar epimerase
VPTVAEMYQALIDRAGSRSRLLHVPQGPTVLALKILHALRLSPLGPYQYNMLGASFEFDIDDTCQRLAWEPTRTNTEMLSEAFDFYQSGSVGEGEDVSAHSRVAAGGVLSLLRHLL